MATITFTTPLPPRLPPELCYLIIDALGDERDCKTGSMPESIARTLRSCALACRHWYPWATTKLRHCWIKLDDVDSLRHLERKFSPLSNALAPHIESLRIRLPISGRYPPSNVLTLLPILFKLGVSSIDRVELSSRLTAEFSQGSLVPQEGLVFPYVSIHPRLPCILTPVFSTVKSLYMSHVPFKNFADFGNFLNCFVRLEVLYCGWQTVKWPAISVTPGCMTRKTEPTFLQNLRDLSLIQTAHDVERVLAALPPHRLRKLHLEFPDIRILNGAGVQPAPEFSGARNGVDLKKFTDLDTLIVHCGTVIEDVSRLRKTLASWKPTRASSRTLILYTTMYGVWEGLWGDEGSEIFRAYANVVEATCVGPPHIFVKICVRDIIYPPRKKEERIFKKAQELFPKTSGQGRLQVELSFVEPKKE